LPLQRRLGELWHEGRLNVAVEHYVTKIVQQKLFSVINQLPMNASGPRVIIACPEREFREIGALAVAYLAATRGCQAYYLGPNLPQSDLGVFCERIEPDLVLLSMTETLPEDSLARLVDELESLSRQYPVAIGGRGARSIAHMFKQSRVELIDDFETLHIRLASLNSSHGNRTFDERAPI
jgi:methanogenic corrinoid protein MtbC1